MKCYINNHITNNKVNLLSYAVLFSAMVLTYFNCLGHDFVFWDDAVLVWVSGSEY